MKAKPGFNVGDQSTLPLPAVAWVTILSKARDWFAKAKAVNGQIAADNQAEFGDARGF